MKMSCFLVGMLVFGIFNSVSALGDDENRSKYIIEHSGIFNGQDFLTLSEYTNNMAKIAGYKDIKRAKHDFEKFDKNVDGLVEFQEMVDALEDESVKIKLFMSIDKNQNGFLDLTEIQNSVLGTSGNLVTGRITEESLEKLLRQNQFDVDFLGQDNQMGLKEWFRFLQVTKSCSTAFSTSVEIKLKPKV